MRRAGKARQRSDGPATYIPEVRARRARSYALHNLLTPPSYDWSRSWARILLGSLGMTLQAAEPQLLEDVDFSSRSLTPPASVKTSLSFPVTTTSTQTPRRASAAFAEERQLQSLLTNRASAWTRGRRRLYRNEAEQLACGRRSSLVRGTLIVEVNGEAKSALADGLQL